MVLDCQQTTTLWPLYLDITDRSAWSRFLLRKEKVTQLPEKLYIPYWKVKIHNGSTTAKHVRVCPFPHQDASSPQPHTPFILRFAFTLFFPPCLGLSNSFISQTMPHAPIHLVLLGLINDMKNVGEQYKWWRCSLSNFLHSCYFLPPPSSLWIKISSAPRVLG